MSKKKPKQELKIEFQSLKNNPVAKFAHRVNRAEFFRDRTVYPRKGKHKDCESFCIRYFKIINTKKFTDTFYSTCLFRLQIQRVNQQAQVPQLKNPNCVTTCAIV